MKLMKELPLFYLAVHGKWQTILTKAYCPILFIVLTIHIALPNVNFIKVLKLKAQV